MKNKNTWVMVPLSDDVSVIEAESGGFICTTEGYTGGPDEKEAARLISAAPDMAEALEYCDIVLNAHMNGHAANIENAIEKARAALVKAGR